MEDFEFKLPDLRFNFKKPRQKSLKILGLVVLGLFAIFLIYQLFRLIFNFPILSALDKRQDFNPDQISKNKDLAIINSVIELPTDQDGTIGTIKNVKSLESRAGFFKKARNGDILVIYPNMTIIYDPDNNNVVDVAKTNLLQ